MRVRWDEFMTAWHDGVWLVDVCGRCGAHSAVPRPTCIHCGSDEASVVPAEGEGVAIAGTTVHHAFYPARRGRVPFTVVIAELDRHPKARFIAELARTSGAGGLPPPNPACRLRGARLRLTARPSDVSGIFTPMLEVV